MREPLFQPSAFWQAARGLLSWRFLVALLIMGGTLEGVAWIAPLIVARDVHQPYLVSHRVCEVDSSNQGRVLTWRANSRGARGDLFHGQAVQIGVLGSSTSSDTLLDQDQTWVAQLGRNLGTAGVSIDNYSRDGASDREAVTILRRMGRDGRRYDALLIMVTMELDRRPATEAEAFLYWGHWAPVDAVLQAPSLLHRRMWRQLQQEPRMQKLWARISEPEQPADDTESIHPLARSNRELRRNGSVRLVDVEYSIPAEVEQSLRDRTRELLEAAAPVSDRVWLILQPVAYDEHEAPGVSDRWYSLQPAPGHDGAYLTNRSLAQGMRAWNAVMADEAHRRGVEVLDLDSAIRPALRTSADLFDDKWHFAPAGAAAAGQIVADTIREDLLGPSTALAQGF